MDKNNREVLNRAYKINDIVNKHIELGLYIDTIEHSLGELTHIRDEKNIQGIIFNLLKIRNDYVDEMRVLLGERHELLELIKTKEKINEV